MNQWLNKMERKFGKYAISNLSMYLIIGYAIGYAFLMFAGPLYDYIVLNPYLIMRGQVWRLVSWAIIPPNSGSLFAVVLGLYFFYFMSSTMEQIWGTFRYNVYIFSGMLFTVIGSFVVMGLLYLLNGQMIAQIGADTFFRSIGNSYFYSFSTMYVYLSVLLAYAAELPNAQFLLFFIIPVKAKWFGIVYGAGLAFLALTGGMVTRIVIIASLLNFLIFFLTGRSRMHMNPKQIKRRHDFNREVRRSTSVTRHKCAICGRTEKDSDDLQFRFCSKCEGNYEYCQDHLFTHEHVKKH